MQNINYHSTTNPNYIKYIIIKIKKQIIFDQNNILYARKLGVNSINMIPKILHIKFKVK